jgi:signal peptidase
MSLVHLVTRAARRTLDIILIALILLVLATVIVARVIPTVTGGATFVVGGGSMDPAIPMGAVVIVGLVTADELAVGDVVSVKVGEQQAIFTHRITRLVDRDGVAWLQTKGDANEDEDPSIIPATAVIGRVAVTLPYAGYAVRLLSTAQGVLFLLALGMLMLAGAWLLESLEIDQASARRRAAQALDAMTPDAPAGEAAAG